jgi:hypothetical protein
MFRLSNSRSVHNAFHPADRIRSSRFRRLLNVGSVAIVVGCTMLTRAGFSDDTKKPDLSKRGAIGVYLYESTDHVLVSKVMPKSPADKAGLKVGDDIRYVNNERIKTANALIDEIASFTPGTHLEIVLRRAGQSQTVKVDVISHAELYGDTPRPKPVVATAPTIGTASPETVRRMRVLEQKMARMQQEMDQLKTVPYVAPPAPPTTTFDINSWLDQHRDGNNDGDPSLFQ